MRAEGEGEAGVSSWRILSPGVTFVAAMVAMAGVATAVVVVEAMVAAAAVVFARRV